MNSSGLRKSYKPGKDYWRSLEELSDKPEFMDFLAREFPVDVLQAPSGKSRREFLRIMSASLALAGITLSELALSGCRWPKEKIVPFVSRPEGRSPGVPVQFATAMEISGVAHPLLVTSYDGRPIKVEGNSSHPASMGATNAVCQASILELYDPDRSRAIIHREKTWELTKSWNDFYNFCVTHFADLKKNDGRGFYVLTEASSSLGVSFLRGRLMELFPSARWYEYEPVSRDNEIIGTKYATGRAYRSHLHLERAETILSLDSDFLMKHPSAVRYARAFAEGRRANGKKMNRLYMVEPDYSVTGAQADRRLAMPLKEISAFAFIVARELLQLGANVDEEIASIITNFGSDVPGDIGSEFARQAAVDLFEKRGKALVTAGASLPPEVHSLVALLNYSLDAVNNTVTYTAEPDQDRPPHVQAISELAREISDRKVKTLLLLGGNPVYNAPSDIVFDQLIKDVETTIHLSLYRDETSRLCTWALPRAHYLESWGAFRAYDGTITPTQPLIEPLFGGKTPEEVLALVIDEEPYKGYDIVRTAFSHYVKAGDFERTWRKSLHDGIVAGTAWQTETPEFDRKSLVQSLKTFTDNWTPVKRGEFELVFREDYSVHDGRFANNGWLQELPDPITKITWDNALLVSANTAKLFDLSHGDVVLIQLAGRTASLPVYILPGHADSAVTLHLGYGRSYAGRVGNNVGVNTYPLRTTSAPSFASGVILVKTQKKQVLATTQDHHAIDLIGFLESGKRVRNLIREATLEEYKDNPTFAKHEQGEVGESTLIAEHEYTGYKWGMAIDLSVCTGCSACVVACQAENNIPIVGKEQVARGREMHWIRVDRCFSGTPSDPRIAFQPLTCHQCENAPCEQVCPVSATQHSKEGLNEMVYNRCIGTRYCANNCPYKVRRFNFFNYLKDMPELHKLLMNPEVTVRSRGVMEKCTFCIQRIQSAKITAKNEGRVVEDGEIVPACAQTCPTSAIVFGDLNDENSAVSKLANSDRAYQILTELNVKPRTSYLARLRNPA